MTRSGCSCGSGRSCPQSFSGGSSGCPRCRLTRRGRSCSSRGITSSRAGSGAWRQTDLLPGGSCREGDVSGIQPRRYWSSADAWDSRVNPRRRTVSFLRSQSPVFLQVTIVAQVRETACRFCASLEAGLVLYDLQSTDRWACTPCLTRPPGPAERRDALPVPRRGQGPGDVQLRGVPRAIT